LLNLSQIAQVSPLWERVPPTGYGGTELIVSLLTDELVRRGHEVTLFASGDSETLAKLESCCPQALRGAGKNDAEISTYQTQQLRQVYTRADEFDLIHAHVDHLAFTHVDLVKTPTVHTTHFTIYPHTEPLWHDARHQNFISISDSQRYTDPIFPFYEKPKDPPYLAFLGRIVPDKGPHLAIEIAKRTGLTLKMAGKVYLPEEVEFFEETIKPLIDGEQIQFVTEINHEEKCELLGGALATLFPITWKEPFGLVMAESMVVGTPVIATIIGSTPEIIADGKTGFLCQDVEQCVAAVERIKKIDRHTCRDHAVGNFGVKRMVDNYEAVYQKILAN